MRDWGGLVELALLEEDHAVKVLRLELPPLLLCRGDLGSLLVGDLVRDHERRWIVLRVVHLATFGILAVGLLEEGVVVERREGIVLWCGGSL